MCRRRSIRPRDAAFIPAVRWRRSAAGPNGPSCRQRKAVDRLPAIFRYRKIEYGLDTRVRLLWPARASLASGVTPLKHAAPTIGPLASTRARSRICRGRLVNDRTRTPCAGHKHCQCLGWCRLRDSNTRPHHYEAHIINVLAVHGGSRESRRIHASIKSGRLRGRLGFCTETYANELA